MGMMFRGSKVDLNISIERTKLIGILKENKETHVATFNKAMEGYKEELVKVAEINLERAKEGKDPKGLRHRKPTNYAAQYDRALGMLELSTDETVKVSAYDYARFVEDDWDWKDEFVGTSQAYGA
jgi:hypothetical protein